MDTKTLVQATANVVRIINLKVGDVYKRVHKPYAGAKSELRFGVVTSIMHNGESAAITSIEVEVSYSAVTMHQKLFDTDTEVDIFEADPSEVREHFAKAEEAARKRIKDQIQAVSQAEQQLADILYLRNRADRNALSAPETEKVEAING